MNILLLVGAGISTSCGIPDFRSDTGIYSMLADYGLDDPQVPPLSQPTSRQDMFDIEVFRDNPAIFYSLAQKIIPSTTKYSPTHAFLRLLQDKSKLLRVYTQNIDNLEQLAGVEEEKLVQCHGSFATASCMKCGHQVPGEEIKGAILAGEVPVCAECAAQQSTSQKTKKRKRNTWDEDDEDDEDDLAGGVMKVTHCQTTTVNVARHNLLRGKVVHKIRFLPPRTAWFPSWVRRRL
jgi:NAD-dependent protein deacetylase SIR2